MSLRLLVVGGTGWLGGTVTRLAAAKGMRVTVLARGRTPAGDLPLIVADRNRPLPDLSGEGFDAVVDTSAYAPDHVLRLLDALGPQSRRYLLISSVSVHDDFSKPITEDSPAPSAGAEDLAVAEAVARGEGGYGAAYGPLKRAAELAALDRLGDNTTILRPGLIAGPGDPTDRFTWWVRRLDRPGPVPLPLPRDRPIQVIDVRDLAAFVLHLIQADRSGIFTCTGLALGFEDFVARVLRLTGAGARAVWLPWSRFEDAGLAPRSDLPLVLPDSADYRHFLSIRPARALEAGLRPRPLVETIADTLAWDRCRRDQPLKTGMTPDQEAPLLVAAG